jgi:predicted glycosyltransferase
VLEEVGVKPGELFTLVRFVGWGAGHDIGRRGLDREHKIEAVNQLRAFGPVFISCEGELPGELEGFRLQLDVTRVHSLMAYAALIFGESATMVSEGAVLGVPGIYIDPVGRGYTDEQEREYGIVFHFTQQQQSEAVEKALSILSHYRKEKWRAIGRRIIEEKIDVTGMIYDVATGNSNFDFF